jgi:hypothetical protein
MTTESWFAESAGEDGVELTVVAFDPQEAEGVESLGNASIAGGGRIVGVGIARFDADALAADPGAELGEVRGPRFEVRGEGAEFGVEGEKHGGSEWFAAYGCVNPGLRRETCHPRE